MQEARYQSDGGRTTTRQGDTRMYTAARMRELEGRLHELNHAIGLALQRLGLDSVTTALIDAHEGLWEVADAIEAN